jgi:hypothetical protein
MPSLDYRSNCGVLEKMFEHYTEIILYKKDKNGKIKEVYQSNRQDMVDFIFDNVI